MELIDTMLIERIRKALIKRYDRDQQIQQMIEEIGAEEGLNESELAIVYQAYLEVKERVYYTSSLVDLWNQIEDVQTYGLIAFLRIFRRRFIWRCAR